VKTVHSFRSGRSQSLVRVFFLTIFAYICIFK